LFFVLGADKNFVYLIILNKFAINKSKLLHMKRTTSTLVIIAFFAFLFNISFAGNVEIKTAKNVALNTFKENYSNLYGKDAGNVSITEEFTVSENSQNIYYVFNISSGGFVIVSADDIDFPVLGYSFESFYGAENQPPQFVYWMDLYKQQIINNAAMKLTASPEIEQAWNRLKVDPENFISVKGTKDVAPLLMSQWDQGCCYNAYCPEDAAATNSCGRCYVGCVATSMAQVMYYWRYPTTGQGSKSYTPSGYPMQSANFGATTYNWNAMTNSCTNQNDAIALLSYHCGVAVSMGYGVDGSGSQTGNWVGALPAYFKYSNTIDDVYKSSYGTTTWEGMIRTEIDAGRPIVYTGRNPTTFVGHAWNLDGYQGTNNFHFNWGWSGYYDGYYLLTALNPGGDDLGSNQEMLINIFPATGYPSYCTGTMNTLTSTVGTLTDGSGPNSDYQNNDDCSWLISPSTPVDHLYITFESIATEASNDVVTIYDGPTTSDPVLGTYSGTTVPTQITSTSPEVLVRFTTNGSVTDAGWILDYFSAFPVFCTGTTILTDASGSFEDGSGVNEYNNSSNCKWDITPTSATAVTLHFNSFSTEASNDKVRVLDIVNSTTLGTFSGTTIPADVTSPSGQMRVIFTSNASVTDQGFSATYSSVVGVDEYSTLKDLSVYPNPATAMLHISFGILEGNDASVQLIDLKGQQVFTEKIQGANTFNKDIDVTAFAKGVYSLRIITSGETINKQVVIQ
jgi:hypothetical protein